MQYDKAIQIDPNKASAFYNSACYKVKKDDIASGLVDLEKALELDKENYLELAKQDKDFESIRYDERYKALIKNYVEERGNKNIK